MIASPCINCCQIDLATGYCAGCHRSLDEIAAWPNADDRQKSAILAAVAQRQRLETVVASAFKVRRPQ